MRAVPEPFRPAATATSQRILVDPARWMRAPDPVGLLGVLQAAVFTDRRLRLWYRSSGRPANTGEPSERVVDPYGLVCKAGVWYLVADQRGEPRLFRVSRVGSAVADEAPVRRRDGVELAELWETLRQQVEDRPAEVAVIARVRPERLDMFRRICAAHLAEGTAEGRDTDAGGPDGGGPDGGGPDGRGPDGRGPDGGESGAGWVLVRLRFARGAGGADAAELRRRRGGAVTARGAGRPGRDGGGGGSAVRLAHDGYRIRVWMRARLFA